MPRQVQPFPADLTHYWDFIAWDEFIPASAGRWKPLVIEGLRWFIDHLPPPRQEALLAGQLALPLTCTAPQRLVALLQQCPTLHKLGQVLARHRDLPENLRLELQQLESVAPTNNIIAALRRIRRRLQQMPSAATADIQLADEALAEGSVAIVIPFTYRAAPHAAREHGVFKLLKPRIKAILREELNVWGDFAQHLQARQNALGLAEAGLQDLLDNVRNIIMLETRLAVEQANLQAAARFYANDARVLVPKLLPWCAEDMTAMEQVFGRKITDSQSSQPARRKLVNQAISALVAQPFWSEDHHAVIHADPHAGNLMETDDGRLAVIDWSLTLTLSQERRAQLVQALIASLTLNKATLQQTLAALTGIAAQHPSLIHATDTCLNEVRHWRFGGVQSLLAALQRLFPLMKTDLRDELMLFRKAWLTLSSVTEDVLAKSTPSQGLERLWALSPLTSAKAQPIMLREAAKHLLKELPRRALLPLSPRQYGSHLSNADLLLLGASIGLLPTRYWWGLGEEAVSWLTAKWADRSSRVGVVH